MQWIPLSAGLTAKDKSLKEGVVRIFAMSPSKDERGPLIRNQEAFNRTPVPCPVGFQELHDRGKGEDRFCADVPGPRTIDRMPSKATRAAGKSPAALFMP